MFQSVFRAAIEFSGLLRSEFIVKIVNDFQDLLEGFTLLFSRKFAELFNYFSRAHGIKIRSSDVHASGIPASYPLRTPHSALRTPMIPREILKKIRLIELRTNRLVSETLAGQYHSVFKGQGMNFEEVREYQPGDEVRAIDWNVTARMNHPFVKKFVEERELTLMLVVDLSGSGLFGSGDQSKRELAAEIASVLAFSAIRNNDKVGLILFTDEVEKFMPPRKGRRHVLRVIREILFYEPKRRGTNMNAALEFLSRVTSHKAIAVILSDFLGENPPSPFPLAPRRRGAAGSTSTLAPASYTALRQANRRHDVVAVHITDRYEMELPTLGRLVLKDAETGEVVEINTRDASKRDAFAKRQAAAQTELVRLFRSARIDSIELRTDTPYAIELGRFFETREKRRLHG